MRLANERGSAAVEFVLVGSLVTLITVAILQVGLALYTRNIIHDAAVEGAYAAARADAQPGDAEEAVRGVIATTLRADIIDAVAATSVGDARRGEIIVTVSATLPLFGWAGPPAAMEVTARAPKESLDVTD